MEEPPEESTALRRKEQCNSESGSEQGTVLDKHGSWACDQVQTPEKLKGRQDEVKSVGKRP